jgi:hypothetical protein
MRTSRALAVVLGILVPIAACTDPMSIPSRPRPSIASHLTTSGPTLHPNSQKYRDNGYHPPTGRSGTAAVTVRALLGKTGRTDVEVTTGSFDADLPNTGSLASVQLKAFDNGGRLLFTRNNLGLGGTIFSLPYFGLRRGTPIQVQSVVRSLDGSRSDVVTVADAVHMRPDLVALSLDAPSSAPVGATVNIQAFIGERLGDTGARANCVLYVDGTAVDFAFNIWVDAGGVVACAMTHRFTTPGTHALEVRAEFVNPGDYDNSNNGTSGSITIKEPADFAYYSAQAQSYANDTWYRALSTLTQPDGTYQIWDQTYTVKGPSQWGDISGLIHRSLAYPIHLTGQMATNGVTINALDVTHESGDYVDWQQGYCASSASFNGGADTYVCVYTSGDLAGYTYVQYDWWGADVRYHSDSYVTSWDPSGTMSQTYIASDWSEIGPMFTFGSDFSAQLSVQGANDATPATAAATFPLLPATLVSDYVDPSCTITPTPLTCFEDHFRLTGVNGFIDSGVWPQPSP